MAQHQWGTILRRARKPLWTMLATGLVTLVIGPLLHTPFANAATGDLGYQGPSYIGAGTAPTADKPQSKLWFNDGVWWADMFDATSRTWHIFRLNRSTQTWTDTGTRDRQPPLHQGRHALGRYPPVRRLERAGVVVHHERLGPAGPPIPVLVQLVDQDLQARQRFPGEHQQLLQRVHHPRQGLRVASSGPPGRRPRRSTSTPPPAAIRRGALRSRWAPRARAGMAADDISSLAAYGRSKIGLMWSNQNTSTFYFAVHRDGDARTAWTDQGGRSPIPGSPTTTSISSNSRATTPATSTRRSRPARTRPAPATRRRTFCLA